MARTTCEPGRSVDVWGKEYFKGKCPYTGKECESWECSRCQVEKNEKEWMEESEEEWQDMKSRQKARENDNKRIIQNGIHI